MTLALLPTNAMALLYGGQICGLTPPQTPQAATCAHCRYPSIAGWCSRCDLEENGVLV